MSEKTSMTFDQKLLRFVKHGARIRDRRSEVINSSSLTGLDQKWSRVLKHIAQHRANSLTFCVQAAMVFIGDVSTIFCKVEPAICFAVFTISPSCMLYEQEATSVNLLKK